MKMIPDKLKTLNHWVGFRTVSGKKIPVSPNPCTFAQRANVNSPDTWGDYDSAVDLVSHGLADSIGFANTQDTNLVFIDIDCHTTCVDYAEDSK